jgi:hypothetical protein
VSKRRQTVTTRRRVTPQKSADFMNIAVEARTVLHNCIVQPNRDSRCADATGEARVTRVGLSTGWCFFSHGPAAPSGARASSLSTLYDHTQLDTPHSVGLLWTGDQPDAETSDNTRHSQEASMDASGGIRTYNRSKQTATEIGCIIRTDLCK